ncbi:MAG: glycosyltransferase family 39 protein [Chloroflexota bacterium]
MIARVQRTPTIVWLGTVVLAALMLRLAVLFRIPILATGDSESYLGPAFDLARGSGFDLSLKRTPGYPVFVAASIAAVGEDLRALGFIQHLLGCLSAVLTFALGRTVFGTASGLLAGLSIAMHGGLLLSEQSVMTEALFNPLIAASLTTLVMASRTGRYRWFTVAGLLIGISVLTRPVAQSLIPLLAIAGALTLAPWPRRARLTLVGLAAYGLITVPWSVYTAADRDSAAIGSLGQSLVGRTARHDRGTFAACYGQSADRAGDDNRRRAALVLQQAADRGSSGKAINTRLRRELGLTAAEADRLMRDIALEAIRCDVGEYLRGSLQRFVRLASGSTERLTTLRGVSDVARREWEDTDTRHLLPPATTAEDRSAAAAAILVALYQPGYLGPLLPLLALVACALAAWSPTHRPALLLGLATVALLAVSAALVGNVPRYRYPVDPLIAVLAAGAAGEIVQHLGHLAAHRGRRAT